MTAAVVSIEVSLSENGIQLNSFQVKLLANASTEWILSRSISIIYMLIKFLYYFKGGISTIVQDCIGKIMTLGELKQTLTRSGINLFPDEDAFCYCEGKFNLEACPRACPRASPRTCLSNIFSNEPQII